ncbi:MAG: sucrase ferredoxin [Cyanobacteria bacterium J06614_10]
MKHFSCAIAAQQAKEDPIGTAGHYQTYVLIECPMPWQANVFDSSHIPAALRHYIQATKREKSIQFLGINHGTAARHAHTTLLIYQQPHLPARPFTTTPPADRSRNSYKPLYASKSFVHQYQGFEYQLESLDQVVPCLQAHWSNQQLGQSTATYSNQPITKQDILVCTHGMRDKCCARFGQPLFREARHLSEQGQLPNTRIWQASHIGGHRFAPTAITLPDV